MDVKIQIDGKKILASDKKTILNVCRDEHIHIPTFCNDKRIKPFTSCHMCVVEVEGTKNPLSPACSTTIYDGMKIHTNTQLISETRKMNLELLLSNHLGDCYPPCTLECPSNVDITGYISLISRKMFREAVSLIRQTNPLPLVCGRVCARPCEDVCRRKNVDSAVAIDWLKRFSTDFERENGGPIFAIKKAKTNKKIAIIGAGPAGLSSAYFLSLEGHNVEIFEKLSQPGGMLRYGIPPYRMPRDLLKQEIDHVLSYGAKLHLNKELGVDFSIKELKKDFDSILITVGAQIGSSTRAENENIKNVFQGVDFLRKFNLGEKFDFTNKTVVVIGGGNTAIDCARSPIRMNAKKVILAYRRTEKEMPANEAEIYDAKEEGVEIMELVAPTKYIEKDGKLNAVEMEIMELGSPDESGRRKPMQTGNFKTIKCDIAIGAVGQKVSKLGLESIQMESWGTVKFNNLTFETSEDGIFCAGDAVRGPDIAIQAIADGKNAAKSICEYLSKIPITDKSNTLGFYIKKTDILSKKELKDHLSDKKKLKKAKMPMLAKQKRISSWDEVEKGLTFESAIKETKRCLECGCQDLFECKLKRYATDYNADISEFKGEINICKTDISHPLIDHDPSKCILCGSCVKICEEVQKTSALGFLNRGFETIISKGIKPDFNASKCTACGGCISVCPVGALTERVPNFNQGPINTKKQPSLCFLCGDLCDLNLEMRNNTIFKVSKRTDQTINMGNLCVKGKFGYEFANNIQLENRKKDIMKIAETIKQFNSIALFISVEATCEEVKLLNDFSKIISATPLSLSLFNNGQKYKLLEKVKTCNLKDIINKRIFYFGSLIEMDNSVFQRKIIKYASSIFVFGKDDCLINRTAKKSFSNFKQILKNITEKEDIICLNIDYLNFEQIKLLVKKVNKVGSKLLILSSYPNVRGVIKEIGYTAPIQEYEAIINYGENIQTIQKLYPKSRIIANFNYILGKAKNDYTFQLLPFYLTGGTYMSSKKQKKHYKIRNTHNIDLLKLLINISKKRVLRNPNLNILQKNKLKKSEISTIEKWVTERLENLDIKNIFYSKSPLQ